MAPEREEQAPRLQPKLKPAFAERDIGRMWRALEDARAGERSASWPRALGLLGGAVLAAALALVVLLPRGEAPLALRDDRALPTALGAREVRTVYHLDDGSYIALDRGARVEVLRNDGAELVTALRRGKSTFDVRPGGTRRWSIEAGVLSVQVVGTHFVVEREPERVRVSVQRGTVLVRGERVPDGVRRLSAGESIELGSEQPAPAPRLEAPVPPTPLRHAEKPARPQPVALKAPSAMERTEPSWFVLSRGGARLAALHLLDRQGGLRAVLERTREARLLLELSDVARAAGDSEAAALALGRAIEQAPDAPEAALAAFTLGRIELEQLARPRAAAEHFAFVLAHPQAASLAEDALVRLVEADVRAGDLAAARAHAAQYLARFPQGRRRDFVTRLAGDLP
jgi:transmembrane sensor